MNKWEQELAELWPDLDDQTKADLLERLRTDVSELGQNVRDRQRSYRKARNLLELGGLWATPQGIEAMRDPNSCEVLRQDLFESIDRLQGAELLGLWVLAGMLAGPQRSDPLGEPWASAIEGWE